VLGNWAQIALAAGRARRAEELAQASLAIAREIGDRYGEALGLNSLGDALCALERLEESAAAYTQAEAIWQELADETGLLHAQLGRALGVAAGGGAGDHAAEILAALPVAALLETSAGPEILLADFVLGWQLLERLGDPHAAAVLAHAHQELQARADRISDPADRQSFLENIPENRSIRSQFESAVK